MIRITKYQLFTLMFIFEIGSTTIFALGIEAKQDAWITILIAMFIGLIYAWIYTEFQKAFPDKNWAEMLEVILGKKIGKPLAVLFGLEWFWHAARNLREYGELIIITTLPGTPLLMLNFTVMLVSLYVLLKGTEVLGRFSEMVLPMIVFFILEIYILIYISGDIHFGNLQPVLGEGIKPVLMTVPEIVVFPFGESFVFMMYWKYVDNKQEVRKIVMLALFLSGILLCCTVIMDITSLGVEFAAIATIPFIESVKLIDIGNIITNIDAIGVIIIFLGGFFKMTIYLNGIALIMATAFKIKNLKIVIIVLEFALLWFSIIFEKNYAYHKWMFPFDTNTFAIVFVNLMPPLILIIYFIKKKRLEY